MASVNMKWIEKSRGSIMMTFTKPQYNVEWKEISKATQFDGITLLEPGDDDVIDDHKAMGYARWVGLAKRGKMVKVTKTSVKQMENTEAATPNKFDELTEDRKKRVFAQINSGKVELSIVARYDSKFTYLIAGNTRLVAQMKWFGEGYVWEYKVPKDQRIGHMLRKKKAGGTRSDCTAL